MAANKRKLNVSAVGFTPSGGSLTSISHVQSVEHDDKGQVLGGRGDNYLFPTHKAAIGLDPSFTVNHQDHIAQASLAFGTKGAFTYKIMDAGGDSSGDVVVTVSNAIIANRTKSSAHQQWASLVLMIETYSSDGTTSPVAYT